MVIKLRKPLPTPENPSSPEFIFRGEIEEAHEQNLYNLQKSAIPWFWLTASVSVVLFPITLILGECVLLRLPSTKTKSPFPISNYGHFRQGARLGAGVGLILLLVFIFVFRVLLAQPTSSNQHHIQQQGNDFILHFICSIALLFSIFAIYKFVIERAMNNAPELSYKSRFNYNYNSDGSFDDEDEEDDHHNQGERLLSGVDSNDCPSRPTTQFPPMSALRPQSNCVDDPSTMRQTTKAEVKELEDKYRQGIERMTIVTMFGSMLLLIIGGAIGLSGLISVLQIS